MDRMEEFYIEEVKEFKEMCIAQKIEIPRGICAGLPDEKLFEMYDATIVHEKPLENALGNSFKQVLSKEKVTALFREM